MNYATISTLLEYLPENEDFVTSNYYGGNNTSATHGPLDQASNRFIMAYKDLSLGWKSARLLAMSSTSFPCFLSGEDLWLFKAYLYCLDNKRFFNKHVAEARGLASNQMRRDNETINALLISDEVDYNFIARKTSLSADTVKAYEKLFFNIQDRKKDYMFIKNVVYPDGRMVEMFDDYLKNEDLGNILMRTGYNNGAEHVLHFAGFKSGLLNSLASGNSMPGQLEALFMANGYLLARNGWLNQRANAVGLHNARNILQASKQGGVEEQKPSPFSGVADILNAELVNNLQIDANVRLLKAQESYSSAHIIDMPA
jgi:hypothetical protein